MFILDPPALFALPPTFDGKPLANVLLASCVVAIVHSCLAIGTFGIWQLGILWTIGPLTLLHHTILTLLLHKQKNETYESGLIPQCVTHTYNSLCLGLVALLWFAAAGTAIHIPGHFHATMAIVWGLVTALVGLVEVCVLGATLNEIKRVKEERQREDLESSVIAIMDGLISRYTAS